MTQLVGIASGVGLLTLSWIALELVVVNPRFEVRYPGGVSRVRTWRHARNVIRSVHASQGTDVDIEVIPL